MSYSPSVLDSFGGLDVAQDPQELGSTGALDLLNVDVSRPGRVRCRDGYAKVTTTNPNRQLAAISPYYRSTAVPQIVAASTDLAGASNKVFIALTTAGVELASKPGASVLNGQLNGRIAGRFGAPGSELVYVVQPTTATAVTTPTAYKWNGSTFAAAALAPNAECWAVKGGENRMVAGNYLNTSASRVGFSNAGDPETWGANDFVEITPGDGEQIVSLVAWQDRIFAFKQTKFAVFGDTATDGAGNPIFNYRLVNSGDGALEAGPGQGTACAGRPGVFFLNARGVYLTTGDTPQLISGVLDPLFLGNVPEGFNGQNGFGDERFRPASDASLCWANERLYVYLGTTDGRTLVWDAASSQWTIWQLPVRAFMNFSVTGDFTDQALCFSELSGSGRNYVQRIDPDQTTDDSTAITWSYSTGWDALGAAGATKVLRQSRLYGKGTVTLSRFADFATSDTQAATLTLGSTTILGYHRKAWKGKVLQTQLAGTGPAEIRQVLHDVSTVREAGMA